MRVIPIALFLSLSLAACDAPSAPDPDEGAPVARAELGWCSGTAAFTPAPAQGLDHLASTLLAAASSPGHSMQDVIAVAAGEPVVVRGKLAYGAVSKDLEDERVRVFVDGCTGWQALGDATTDADGRVALTVSRELPAGVYDVRLEVLGDASLASGRIWVLPAGTHLVVSDVDGTLTTSDGELMQDILADFYEPIGAAAGAARRRVALDCAEHAIFTIDDGRRIMDLRRLRPDRRPRSSIDLLAEGLHRGWSCTGAARRTCPA